jgi:polyisoprenyl-teichoic acid--peptidoglycan teichoic acid transferase
MRKKRALIFILVIILIIGFVSIYLYLNMFLAKPLGPSLSEDLSEQSTVEVSQLNNSEKTSIAIQTPDQTSIYIQTQQPIPTLGSPLCGKTQVLTILLSGIDFRGDNYLYGLADVIRIIRIDFTKPKVSIFTLDRDFWVEIPGIQEHYGITHGKLNQSYFYGVPAMGYYDGAAGGAGLLAKTIKLNFGLTVDHYAVVSMAAFVKGVDALGGIDVNLPYPVSGKLQELSSFDSGFQHLSGERALDLARIRYGYSSLIRVSDQDAIIIGIVEKIYTPEVILKIPALLQALKGTVLTDLSPDQLNDMVCLIRKMDKSEIVFGEIPDSYYKQSSIYDPNMHETTFIWDIDFNVIRSYVNQFQTGLWP